MCCELGFIAYDEGRVTRIGCEEDHDLETLLLNNACSSYFFKNLVEDES